MPFTLYTDPIVISGISAKLPNSANMEEFRHNLLSGADMVTEERPRWAPGFLGLPKRNGRLMELDKFDARFFGVHAKQAQSMDPQLRMLLELTYEAIIDAGVNPAEIRGSSTGVFIGVSGSDSETFNSFHPDFINGYVSPGHHRSMLANRISYTFDLRGPSFPIDTACSSSMLALESAVNAIRLGKCDAAIVGGSNLILHPYPSFHSHKLGMFSPDGKCKSFDASGDGYVRSEGVAVIYIQKKDVARRAYATVLNIRSNTDGFKDNGVTFPSGAVQKELLEATYAEVDVDPRNVEYFEAHGTGTAAGDPQELNSVTEVFCGGGGAPSLLIGSVKSNAGHLEPVAGLASIAKMIVAVQEGAIPANLHYRTPNPEIPGLSDGRLKVVTENSPWKGGIFGINSFGWGGANVHAILEGFPRKIETVGMEKEPVPLLVPFSGRTEEAVRFGLENVNETKENRRELVALCHEIHRRPIAGHLYRGFTLIEGTSPGGAAAALQSVKIQEAPVSSSRRPIWFIFSGMGSQSPLHPSLLDLTPFRASIERSAATLREHVDFDLMSVLTPEEPDKTFEIVTDSFVNIVAVQIALIDTLRAIGLEPDGFFGHSVGEVACSYADGCLTQEQTILLAYWRGRSLLEAKCAPGAMAAVGLSFEAATARSPEGVVVACHNTADGVTISGPVAAVQEFVSQLKSEGVFAKVVPTSGFGFHSPLVAPASDFLREKLRDIFPAPKERSAKWISTSSTGVEGTSTCSIEYHLNNLVSPVRFADALSQIPENSVVIELAPHVLLQALLRRGTPASCMRVGLTHRDAVNGVEHLLQALGGLFLSGVSCNFSGLHTPVSFPVPSNTPMLAPMVQWDHSHSWEVASFSKPYRTVGESVLDVSLATEEYSFLADHVIDGRNICPVMLYVYAVWKAFATLREAPHARVDEFPVVFEAVHFKRPILLSKDHSVRFFIQILESSGKFEIEEGGQLLATGTVRQMDGESSVDSKNRMVDCRRKFGALEKSCHEFTKADLYKELKLRGYEYKPRFMGVSGLDFDGTQGTIDWTAAGWVPFLDSMLHALILGSSDRNLELPASIGRLAINPKLFLDFYKQSEGAKLNGMPIIVDRDLDLLSCPGIELRSVGTDRASRRPLTQKPPIYNQAVFTPYHEGPSNNTFLDSEQLSTADTRAITNLFDIILDNSSKYSLEAVEFLDEQEPSAVSTAVVAHLQEIDAFRMEYKLTRSVHVPKDCISEEWASEGATVEFFENVSVSQQLEALQEPKDVLIIHSAEFFLLAAEKVAGNGFVVLITENSNPKTQDGALQLVARRPFAGREAFLYRKVVTPPEALDYVLINVHSRSFEWFAQLKAAMATSAEAMGSKFRILLLSLNDTQSGVVGLVKCLRKEPGGSALRYVLSLDKRMRLELNSEAKAGAVAGLKNLCCNGRAKVMKQILGLDLVHNVIDSQGRLGFYAHHRFTPQDVTTAAPAGAAFIGQIVPGDANSFGWIEAPMGDAENAVEVHFAVLNPAELQAQARQEASVIEFSGVEPQSGKRVIGISTSGSGVATKICTEEGGFLVELSDAISLEEGVTLPLSYTAAIHALLVRGRITTKSALLIHDGASPLGQAALHLAAHCKIEPSALFTTVETEEQLQFLLATFPEALIPENVLKTDGFEAHIRKATRGRGVDFVLNTLTSEEGNGASLRALANRGTFVDMARRAKTTGAPSLASALFEKSATYHRVTPGALLDTQNPERSLVLENFKHLLDAGALKPLQATVFGASELPLALRSASKGKIVLKLQEKPEAAPLKVHPRTYFHPDHVYILAGGLGDTGLEMADWMVTRGAKLLILANRRGVSTSYQRYQLRKWRQAGVEVETPCVDITNAAQVETLLHHTRGRPIGGIFNLSMVLRDSFISSMSPEDFEAALKPKIEGTRNLDTFARRHCTGPELRYFVVFSSITAARGNEGQCNYGYGNSVAERLVEERIADGLPGMAIQFGPIGDVGYVEYGMGGSSDEKIIAGTHPQRIRSVIQSLDKLLRDPSGVKSSTVIAKRNSAAKGGAGGALTLLESIGTVLGLADVQRLDQNAKLGELGMDSLMAVEMRQMIERDFGLFHSLQELRSLTVGELVAKSGKK